MRFVHDNLPQRVRFGSGEAAASLEREIGDLGASRVMVIASNGEADLADRITNGLPVALRHHDVVMHVPVEVAERARDAAKNARADAVVSVGGGSTTGLAKAIALTSGLPVIAVPTTYAGSEATAVWGLTEGARKTTGTDPRVLPKVIVYDAALTTSLPVEMSVVSGLNALAHCVDAMWGPKADPINAAFAAEGIRSLRTGLPKVVARPEDIDGREHALYAAYLSAAAFASAGSGLHHKICHVLGGAYNLPHAQTHAVVLPYVLAFNAPRAAEAERRIAAAFGTERAIDGLRALRAELGAPRALRDYGFAEADIPAAAEAILPTVPPSNPRPVTAEDLRRLLHAAWAGANPELSRTPEGFLPRCCTGRSVLISVLFLANLVFRGFVVGVTGVAPGAYFSRPACPAMARAASHRFDCSLRCYSTANCNQISGPQPHTGYTGHPSPPWIPQAV